MLFDLDGTLARSEYPSWEIGAVIPETVEILRQYHQMGYVCSIYTSRPATHTHRIQMWLIQNDLDKLIYEIKTGKPIFGLLIDDRSWCPEWLR